MISFEYFAGFGTGLIAGWVFRMAYDIWNNLPVVEAKSDVEPSSDESGEISDDESTEYTSGLATYLMGDQDDILERFKHIVGMNLDEAKDVLKQAGYGIYIIYINRGPRYPLEKKNEKIIGVRIEDDGYNWFKRIPSEKAIISELIDVGGTDDEYKGLML